MKLKILIGILCTILSISTNSQDISHIYIGQINCDNGYGSTKKIPLKKSTTIFGGHPMDTSKIIQIFLTEHGIGPFTYSRGVRLYYDKGFKIEYWDTDFQLDTVTFQFPVRQKKSSNKFSVDSIFSLLVASGAFSLPDLTNQEIAKTHKPSWLTNNKLKRVDSKFSVDDGNEFLFEFKIGNCHARRIFNNPQMYQAEYPDIQTYRRQSEIIAALFLNFD